MKLILEDVVVSFPNVFRVGKFGAYDASFIFEENSKAHKLLSDTITKLGSGKWADKWPSVEKGLAKSNKFPIKDGSDEGRKGYAGKLYVRAKNKFPPVIANRDATELKESDGVIYAGAIVNAHLDVSVYEIDIGKGVRVTLLGMQFVRDGERLSAAPTVDLADFKVIEPPQELADAPF